MKLIANPSRLLQDIHPAAHIIQKSYLQSPDPQSPMAPAAIFEEMRLDTSSNPESLDRSETPSPVGPLRSSPPTKAAIAPVWLKLNSTAPIYVEVDRVPAFPDNEPFTGAKKLRYLLENTDELVVCPGVYDGLSARTAIELGFKSLYMVSRRTLFSPP